jgi:iron-sulfur cluster assembly protein
MVIMTEHAVDAIRSMSEDPSAGLRISGGQPDNQLSLAMEPGPVDGDAVVESAGARLFLDPVAAAILDDKALDAQSDQAGMVRFTVSPVGM